MTRKIVCAANRHPHTKLVVCGVRHFDTLMVAQMLALNMSVRINWEQGFVDNQGKWLDREEAMIVALDAKQVDEAMRGIVRDLFSEDLY